jgi:hypothetical protein
MGAMAKVLTAQDSADVAAYFADCSGGLPPIGGERIPKGGRSLRESDPGEARGQGPDPSRRRERGQCPDGAPEAVNRFAVSSSLASLQRRVAGVRKTLAASELWVDVVVNRRNIRIPKQALYAAASHLRQSTEEYVRWEDCASAVAFVLSAMEAHGVFRFCQPSRGMLAKEFASSPSRKGNTVPAHPAGGHRRAAIGTRKSQADRQHQ